MERQAAELLGAVPGLRLRLHFFYRRPEYAADMQPALPILRLAAVLIDVAMTFGSYFAAVLAYYAFDTVWSGLIPLGLVAWWCWTLKYGQTPGKQMVGLKAVNRTTGQTRWWVPSGGKA